MGTRVNGVSLDGAGMANPMTTLADLIVGGADGEPARLGIGTEGQALLVTGGEPMWSPLPAGGVDTSLQAAPDTGWTAAGDGSAAIAAGVATLTTTDAQTEARLRRTSPSSPFAPAIEIIARVTRTATPASGNHWQSIGLGNEGNSQGYLLQLDNSGLTVGYYSSGSWTFIASAGHLSTWDGGELWLRLVVSTGFVAFFQGTGATLPTSWTLLAARGTSSPDMRDVIGPGLMTHLHVAQGRAGGGSGDFTCTARDIQWRSLLGAPV